MESFLTCMLNRDPIRLMIFGIVEYAQEMFSLYSLYLQSLPLAYIQSCTRLLLFGTFELAISMPVELGKSYIQCLAKKLLFSPLYEVK
jgi:hypothetical protein